MVKKRGGNRKSSKKKKFHKTLPGKLWFVLGVVITLWTVLWLLISFNSHEITSPNPVVLFGIGFYSMVIFIIGTLIFYICNFIKKIRKKKRREKKKKTVKHVKKKTSKKKSKKKK